MFYVSSKIAGGSLKIHPGIMLLGFIGGTLLLGFKGLILGPVILGTLKLYLDTIKNNG
jgi:predicted PurR-regulated permease PerM